MRVIVFSGPSLPPSEIPRIPGLEWRPPLRQGDLRRAAAEGPDVLGVVDGHFETTPTVWHEEILFALDRGIAVYGAASIGALRAAELHVFGMEGIGRIFEWFRDGFLEDDDEVALLHGPPELGFPALTEAMVNVRATIAEAIRCEILSGEIGAVLIAVAKSLFYKRRTWEHLFEKAARLGVPHAEVDQACDWLARGAVNLKRLDARLMLEAVLQEQALAEADGNCQLRAGERAKDFGL
jgi:hypothetical protein